MSNWILVKNVQQKRMLFWSKKKNWQETKSHEEEEEKNEDEDKCR